MIKPIGERKIVYKSNYPKSNNILQNNYRDTFAININKTDKKLQKDIQKLSNLSKASNISKSNKIGSKRYWTKQATHMADFFSKVSKDEVDGGFFTHIDHNGNVSNPNEKFLMPTSRQIYSYATTYQMTKDKKYLDLAKHGVDFILKNHIEDRGNGEISWVEKVNKDGSIPDGEKKTPLEINKQTYGLTGLIAYYKATKDSKILDVIKSSHKFITNHFGDKENGGFFDKVNPETLQANNTKSYNSTVYPATSALLEMADIANGDWKKEVNTQLKDLADNFIKHFPDEETGFIRENFTNDWKEDWRDWQKQPEGSIGVSGHNTQGALFLLRAERYLKKQGMLTTQDSKKYRDTAKKLVDSMLDKTYDKQNGGWFDSFIRETGKNIWHTNKAFWQQEEGYLANLAMSKIDDNPKYKEASDKTLKFWDDNFIDREIGGDRQVVSREGDPLAEPKGGPGKSSYHAVEMAKLAMEINKWN